MNVWLDGTSGLLVHFFVRETPAETYFVIALCVLLGALALSRVSTGLGTLKAFYTTAILLMPPGLIVLIAALALPHGLGMNVWWMPLAAAMLALLAVVVPVTMLCMRGGYVNTLIAWMVAVLVTGAMLTLEPRVKQSFDGFKKGFESGSLFNLHQTKTELWK
jgi:hypothetical protein